MPGHLNWNTENHLCTQHTHLHTAQRQEVRFCCSSPLASWAQLPASVCVCVFLCVCASVRVCRQVGQQTLTVRFHAPQAVPPTIILCLGVEVMIGPCLLQETFTNISRSQLWVSHWPPITILPHLVVIISTKRQRFELLVSLIKYQFIFSALTQYLYVVVQLHSMSYCHGCN